MLKVVPLFFSLFLWVFLSHPFPPAWPPCQVQSTYLKVIYAAIGKVRWGSFIAEGLVLHTQVTIMHTSFKWGVCNWVLLKKKFKKIDLHRGYRSLVKAPGWSVWSADAPAANCLHTEDERVMWRHRSPHRPCVCVHWCRITHVDWWQHGCVSQCGIIWGLVTCLSPNWIQPGFHSRSRLVIEKAALRLPFQARRCALCSRSDDWSPGQSEGLIGLPSSSTDSFNQLLNESLSHSHSRVCKKLNKKKKKRNKTTTQQWFLSWTPWTHFHRIKERARL